MIVRWKMGTMNKSSALSMAHEKRLTLLGREGSGIQESAGLWS